MVRTDAPHPVLNPDHVGCGAEVRQTGQGGQRLCTSTSGGLAPPVRRPAASAAADGANLFPVEQDHRGGSTVSQVGVAQDRQKHLAQLRMSYAREVQSHGQQSRQAVLAHADYIVERVRLEVCPEVIGWADTLDAAHRAAVADLLRAIADGIDRAD
jgi:hypothetical protein